MRILMLIPYPNVKGPILKHTRHLVAFLLSQGNEVSTEYWGRHKDHESLSEKIKGRAYDIFRIQKVLKGNNFDVMVIKTSLDWSTLSRDIPLLMITRRLCRKKVIQFHGSSSDTLNAHGYLIFKLLSRFLLRLSDASLVLSSEEQRDFTKFFPQHPMYIVSNPFLSINYNISSKDKVIVDLPSDKPIVLFVGRLIKEKGIIDLINAMPIVLKSVGCHLLIVGDGDQKKQVINLIRTLKMYKYISITGHLTGNALLSVYRLAKVFVFPTYWKEGFPTVITEAMDAGLPIITTKIRGVVDRLSEGKNVLFVPAQKPGSIAEAVVKILINSKLRNKMADANRKKVKDFSPQLTGRHYQKVLQEIVDAH
jgi:glycosyltransferase involved in cell wall biosynthesis